MSWARCIIKGCPTPAKWVPILMLKPDPEADKRAIHPGAVARGRAGLPHCDEHRAGVTAESFVTPQGYAQIVAGFRQGGFAAPDPDIELDWEPLPACSKNGCTSPAVVEMVASVEGSHLLVRPCAEHLAEFRRLQLEGLLQLEYQEVEIIPEACRAIEEEL